MRFLRYNTAVIVTVGPFYDKTDGVTIETALTITNERITLTADTDAGSAPTNILDNVTGATTLTDNDLNYITGNDAGMMQLELSAANTNRVGRMLLSITDAANHVPVFHEFFVLPQAIYDWFTGVIVPLPANVTQLLGTAWLTPGTAGTPDVNAKQLGAAPVTATTSVTFSAASTVASTTNITAGTMTTTTNLTNLPAITANWLTAAGVAADAGTEIASAVWDMDATAHQTQGTFGQAIGDPAADTNTLYKAVVTDATGATVGVDVVDLKTQVGTAGAGLTAIDLPNQTMDIVGNITGNLSGSVGSVTGAVGSVTGAVGSVTGNVGGNVVGSVASVTAAVGITSNVKKNQALAKVMFLITDSTGHAPKTSAASIVATRSIDGGAFAAGTLSAVTEVSNGIYYVDFASGDLNGNVITLRVTSTSNDDVFMTIITAP